MTPTCSAPFDQGVTFLYVSDLEQSTAFLRDTLELPLVLSQRPDGETKDFARIFQIASTAFLGIVLSDPKSKACTGARATEENDTVTVTLVADDVDGWATKLKKRGVVLEKEPKFNARYLIYNLFFRDPDGNLFEIQRFCSPTWPRVPTSSSSSLAQAWRDSTFVTAAAAIVTVAAVALVGTSCRGLSSPTARGFR